MNINQSLISSGSDSLIYGLCREIEYIRQRTRNANHSLTTCKDNILKHRLNIEIQSLENRLKEVKDISKELKYYCKESISRMLLDELCQRSLKL